MILVKIRYCLSTVKEYPPEHHALSHDSNPLAAGVSAVKQKIKDDTVKTFTKPTKVSFSHNLLIQLHCALFNKTLDVVNFQ